MARCWRPSRVLPSERNVAGPAVVAVEVHVEGGRLLAGQEVGVDLRKGGRLPEVRYLCEQPRLLRL